MRIIILTAIQGGTYSDYRDEQIRVNPSYLRWYGPRRLYDGSDGSYVVLGDLGDDRLYVRETPAEIDDKLPIY